MPLTILSLEDETEFAVLEMGMSGFGEISFLSKLANRIMLVITNIGEAHMQDLGSREGIAKAKFEIIDGLQPKAGSFSTTAMSRYYKHLLKSTEFQAISFGYGKGNELSLGRLIQRMKEAILQLRAY